MFAGHFGLAAAVKAKSPTVPLWALMVATQFLDIIFIPFFILGIEYIEPIDGGGYGANIIRADYTHSLVGTIVISFLIGLIASKFWGKQGGTIIGSVVFSHWIIDLIVHRADMAILPGNAGNLPLLGLGLWKWPIASMLVEAAIIIVGIIMYYRSVTKGSAASKKGLSITTGVVMGILLLLSFVLDAASGF